MAVSMARLQLAPGAETAALIAPGPHLLLAQQGELTVRINGSARWWDNGQGRDWIALPDVKQEVMLRPGDALLLAPRTAAVLHNHLELAATVLGVVGLPMLGPRPSQAAVSPVVALYHSAWLGTPGPWRNGVRGTVLATTESADMDFSRASCAQWLRIQRFMLAPTQQIPERAVAGLELMAVESGRLVSQAGELALRPGSLQAMDLPTEQVEVVSADQTFKGWVMTGRAAALTNEGELPVRLVRITLDPRRTDPC
jgi:hypothetical protein